MFGNLPLIPLERQPHGSGAGRALLVDVASTSKAAQSLVSLVQA
jgi:hypothetical protein